MLPEVLRGTDGLWIGEDGLWVEVSWVSDDPAEWRRAGEYGFKYATVTLVNGHLSSPPGQPRIEVRRLDGPRQGAGGFGGYASASGALPHWWPTVIELPTGGCWVVTEKSTGTAVSFHVQVP